LMGCLPPRGRTLGDPRHIQFALYEQIEKSGWVVDTEDRSVLTYVLGEEGYEDPAKTFRRSTMQSNRRIRAS